MKAYLLICFFLLFYSINSITQYNYKEGCEIARQKCNASCSKLNRIGNSLYQQCKFKCKVNYNECLIRNSLMRKHEPYFK